MSASATLPRTAWTVPEVAASWGVPQERVRDLIRGGQLRARRHGQRWIVPASALDEYLAGSDGGS